MTVLSAARARRLVRAKSDRARRRLTAAVKRGESTAVEAVFLAWQRNPEAWAFVPAAVFAAAVDPAVGAAARAAIGAFCTSHGAAPDNTVDRALFYVLTGQHEQHEALDPDGTLLSSAYRGATEATREALRDTMVGAGELTMVRVIADRPDRTFTAEEAEYLTANHTRAGEWDRLWRLLPSVPLVSAVRAARVLGDWRPDDDAGREFLARLRDTDPESVTALGTAAVTKLNHYVANELSFAPDKSELAVTSPGDTTVYALPGGRRVVRYGGPAHDRVLALGGATIVYRGQGRERWSIVRRSPGVPREVLLPGKRHGVLGRTPGGFVVVTGDEGVWHGAAAGPWSRMVPAADLPVVHAILMKLMAADPASGRLAMMEFRTLILIGPDGEKLAGAQLGEYEEFLGAFVTPDHLVGTRGGVNGSVVSWRREGQDLARVAEISLHTLGPPIPVPGRDLVVVRQLDRLTWLDPETLAEKNPLPELPPVAARLIAFTQDGSLAAVATRNDVTVHDLGLHRLALLAGVPLARLPYSALEIVAALEDRSPVAGLLHAGLAYRFAADVALGSDGRLAGGEDDIALGGGS